MKYFNTLPKVLYTNVDGVSRIATNIITRSSVIPNLLNNPSLYYTYYIQDHDTPEIIASKYYGDPYRYWMIFYVNQIFDGRWDFPMNYERMNAYINDKYASAAAANNQSVLTYTQTTISQYNLIITTTDLSTQNTTIDTYIIDANTYANTINSGKLYTVGNNQVSVVTQTSVFSIYDTEINANEARKTIKLINTQYASSIEAQFIQLMGS